MTVNRKEFLTNILFGKIYPEKEFGKVVDSKFLMMQNLLRDKMQENKEDQYIDEQDVGLTTPTVRDIASVKDITSVETTFIHTVRSLLPSRGIQKVGTMSPKFIRESGRRGIFDIL